MEGRGGLEGEGAVCLGDLHLEAAASFLMGVLETELGEKCECCSWSAERGESAGNVVW